MIARKNNLAALLSRMQAMFPDEFDFVPRTWACPDQLAEFREFHKEHYGTTTNNTAPQHDDQPKKKPPVYIVKPDSGSQGDGIFLVSSPRELVLAKKAGVTKPAVVQEYLDSPLLIDGYKFDLRVYVLLLAVSPKPVFHVFREGMARFCTVPYEAPTAKNFSTVYMHLTNYSLNKKSEGYVHVGDDGDSPGGASTEVHDDDGDAGQGEGSKRTISSVIARLEADGHDMSNFWDSIDDIVCKTMLSLAPLAASNMEQTFAGMKRQDWPHCFQVLGFDIIFDSEMKPYLLEINANPSLRVDFDEPVEGGTTRLVPSPVDELIKIPMLAQSLQIVTDTEDQVLRVPRSWRAATPPPSSRSRVRKQSAGCSTAAAQPSDDVTGNTDGGDGGDATPGQPRAKISSSAAVRAKEAVAAATARTRAAAARKKQRVRMPTSITPSPRLSGRGQVSACSAKVPPLAGAPGAVATEPNVSGKGDGPEEVDDAGVGGDPVGVVDAAAATGTTTRSAGEENGAAAGCGSPPRPSQSPMRPKRSPRRKKHRPWLKEKPPPRPRPVFSKRGPPQWPAATTRTPRPRPLSATSPRRPGKEQNVHSVTENDRKAISSVDDASSSSSLTPASPARIEPTKAALPARHRSVLKSPNGTETVAARPTTKPAAGTGSFAKPKAVASKGDRATFSTAKAAVKTSGPHPTRPMSAAAAAAPRRSVKRGAQRERPSTAAATTTPLDSDAAVAPKVVIKRPPKVVLEFKHRFEGQQEKIDTKYRNMLVFQDCHNLFRAFTGKDSKITAIGFRQAIDVCKSGAPNPLSNADVDIIYRKVVRDWKLTRNALTFQGFCDALVLVARKMHVNLAPSEALTSILSNAAALCATGEAV
eukprot:m.128176 g.128176  ORF g.128176 m.128176 type:complete len:868 (-) comp16729_c0_seq1:43-2646(-)